MPVAELKQKIERQETGYISFQDKEKNYMIFTPAGVNGWYLLNVMPVDVIDAVKNSVMNMTYMLSGVIVIMFSLTYLYILQQENQKRKELKRIIYRDELTGGDSYRAFCEKAESALRNAHRPAAFVAMDIEKFKLINELFGYDKGDEVIRFIYKAWNQWKKEDELIAHRIADRFVLLVFYGDENELAERIETIIDVLQNSELNAGQFVCRPKIGVYRIRDGETDVQTIQNYAVMAHSKAKAEGGAGYKIYDENMREMMLKQKLMEDKLEKAYKSREFTVFYQPKYDAQTQRIVGAEALVRWFSSQGTVSPAEFIPVAEKSRFIIKIDEFVFSEVCAQLREWKRQGLLTVPVSVNVSREHLQDFSFVEKYCKIRDENGIGAEEIQIEITESAVFENWEALLRTINELRRFGFQILMDDFGTGYSSLMMLQSVPIDEMKLDKSFVDDYKDKRGEQIIRCVIGLAKNLNIAVTAEGVETKEQYCFLKEMQCDKIQGYYFAKPMPACEYELLLVSHTKESGTESSALYEK